MKYIDELLQAVKKGKFFLFFSVIFILFLCFTPYVSAIDITNDPCEGGSCFEYGMDQVKDVDAIESEGTLSERIIAIINTALIYIGILLLIVVLYAGVLLIMSNGDEEALSKARTIILYAILGVIIIILSYSIVNFIASVALGDKKDIQTDGGGINAGNTEEGSNGGGTTTSEDTGSSNNSNDTNDTNDNDSGDIDSDIDDILNDIKDLEDKTPLQESEIQDLRDRLTQLYTRVPHTVEVTAKYNEISNLLNQLSSNPSDTVLVKRIGKKFEEFNRIIKFFPQVKAKIFLSSDRSSIPVLVNLSGEKTYVKNGENILPKNENYRWKMIGPDGLETDIGNGIIREVTLENPGRYVFFLTVPLLDSAGNEAGIRGEAKLGFTAKPKTTESGFTVNGKTFRETLEFTESENQSGIIFDPSLVEVQSGRSISRYLWDLGGKKIEKSTSESLTHSFPEKGKYKLSLQVTDNTGKSYTANASVVITDVVAYFKLSKKKYKIGEDIQFSAKKSKSSTGSIVEYDWKITDPEGDSLQFTDESFTQTEEIPGNYTVQLTVKDSNGESASFSDSFLVTSQKPSASFSFSIPDKGDPAHVFFDASGSSDTSGKIFYSWDFDNDGVIDEQKSESAVAEFTYEKAKRYSPRLILENKYGDSAEKTKKIDISSTLTAKIGVEKIVFPVEYDIPFEAISNNAQAYEWNFNDGNGVETLAEKNIKHSFSKSGQYRVTLTVNSENGEKNTVQKTLFIGAVDSPIAAFEIRKNKKVLDLEKNLCGSGKDGITVYRNQTITFSAADSVNRDGTARGLDYEWKFGKSGKEKKEVVQWKFLEASAKGKCEEVSVQVSDRKSGNTSLTEKIYVFVENALPVLESFEVVQPAVKIAPLSVVLKANANDSDGKIAKYSWWATRVGSSSSDKIQFHSTTQGKTVLILPRFGKEGEEYPYTFHVQIEDADGATVLSDDIFGKSSEIPVLTGENKSPIVELSLDKKKIKMGDTIVFTANAKSSGGTDLNGKGIFKWDFNGNNRFEVTGKDATSIYKYMKPGQYTVRLKVIYQGLATSVTEKVTVERVSKLPLASFTAQKVGKKSLLVSAHTSQFDGTVAGNSLQYEWDKNLSEDSDGDGNPKNDVDGNTIQETFVYPDDTKKVQLQLKIFDLTGGTDTQIRKISFDRVSGIVGSTDSNGKSSSGENSGNHGSGNNVSGNNEQGNNEGSQNNGENNAENPSNSTDTGNTWDDISDKIGSLVNESIQIITQSPMTSLEVFGGEEKISVGEKIEFFAFVKNADGTPYQGEVEFSVQKGKGNFSPQSVQAIAGRASTTFSATAPGTTEVKITATQTVSGEISETTIFEVDSVKENKNK